ncbi:hypothetical protein ElyMa_004166100 [Elysia marginata]|uniref:Uncharacterized protein n=1 Tax=Elysia marginata TaxID=1093978 RepID=A0AAV4GHA1_9GAST|nr:hypothetical protein ElyMa_004166100 [Elysia marginata]
MKIFVTSTHDGVTGLQYGGLDVLSTRSSSPNVNKFVPKYLYDLSLPILAPPITFHTPVSETLGQQLGLADTVFVKAAWTLPDNHPRDTGRFTLTPETWSSLRKLECPVTSGHWSVVCPAFLI